MCFLQSLLARKNVPTRLLLKRIADLFLVFELKEGMAVLRLAKHSASQYVNHNRKSNVNVKCISYKVNVLKMTQTECAGFDYVTNTCYVLSSDNIALGSQSFTGSIHYARIFFDVDIGMLVSTTSHVLNR